MSATVAPAGPALTAAPAPAWASDRDAYRATLLELAREDERIWCLDSDMGGLEKLFEAELPGQYVDLGIAEANLVTVAAGLASTGIVPFVNTMAAFASARALEQVKVDVSYPGLPVRIVATHSGLSASSLGPTHHALQDLAAMRSLPNLTVLTPADPAEAARMVRAAAYLPGPVYLRLGRGATPPVCPPDAEFVIGRALRLRDGNDVTVIAAGALPARFALDAAELLAVSGISCRVLNMHTIKPLDEQAVLDAATTTAGIVTVEEHSVIGGLGGAVAEVVTAGSPTRVLRIGAPDSHCAAAGNHATQVARAGIGVAQIVSAARRLVGLP